MRKSSRRLWAALVGSIFVHALLVVLLLRQREAPPAPAPVFTEIELREISPPPRPAPRASEPPKVAERHPAAVHRRRVAEPAPAPKTSAPVEPSRVPAQASAAADDVRLPPAPSAAVRPPDLSNAGAVAARRVAEVSLALAPPSLSRSQPDWSIEAPEYIADANARVNAMINEGQGRSKVERGLVDPYFHQLGDAMSEGWKPEPKLDEKGMKGFIDELARGLSAGMGAYAEAAAAYGRTGDPNGGANDVLSLPEGNTARVTTTQLISTRLALVRLTQGRDGHLIHVELVQPSIDPVMDAEILRELRVGEMIMPVPPATGQGIRDPIRSLWAFQLKVSIAPPAPMLSGSFDVSALFDKKMGPALDVRLPLSRRVTKIVRLVSVD